MRWFCRSLIAAFRLQTWVALDRAFGPFQVRSERQWTTGKKWHKSKFAASGRDRACCVTFALFLLGKLHLNSLPCSRSEVPAIVIPTTLEFHRPLQRIDRPFEGETIVFVVAFVGNVNCGHWQLHQIRVVTLRAVREYKPTSQTLYRRMSSANAEGKMNTVVCSTSMASAFNVVLNLACIWLLFIIMADVRQIRNSGKL